MVRKTTAVSQAVPPDAGAPTVSAHSNEYPQTFSSVSLRGLAHPCSTTEEAAPLFRVLCERVGGDGAGSTGFDLPNREERVKCRPSSVFHTTRVTSNIASPL